MKSTVYLLLASVALLFLSGCSGLSTFKDSKDSFSCVLPDGMHCTSLSENYDRQSRLFHEEKTPISVSAYTPSVPVTALAKPHRLRSEPEANEVPYETLSEEWWARYEKKAAYEREHPSKLHSDPRTTRRRGESIAYLLLLPRVDKEGDLHLQKEIWLRLENPTWEIERMRSDFLESLSLEM